jgi:hypothetical protein
MFAIGGGTAGIGICIGITGCCTGVNETLGCICNWFTLSLKALITLSLSSVRFSNCWIFDWAASDWFDLFESAS